MFFKIKYFKKVVKKDIPALSSPAKKLIKRAIEERLMVNPVSFGKPLRYGLYGQRRLRVGDYRVIFTIDHEKKIVTINAIGHRKNIYDE